MNLLVPFVLLIAASVAALVVVAALLELTDAADGALGD